MKHMDARGHSALQAAAMDAKKKLLEAQNKMHTDPSNSSYAAEEKEALLTYKTAWKDYNTMLHQKAKLHWLKEGDENSKTFFNSIKARKSQNTINTVMREDGTWAKSPAEVSEAFITFYKGLLGSKVQGPRSSRKLWTLGRN